uniref:Uncharacterized protein n=1 Tax=Panagrolaimus sp. ES5 TaxID=591445 RepID=A0AC34FRC2_9BILA
MPQGTAYAGQLYIVDMEEANRIRCGAPSNKKVEPRLFRKLEEIIREKNIFAKSFKMLNDTFKEEKEQAKAEGREPETLVLAFDKNINEKLSRNYNAPTANEVAAVYRMNPDDLFIP